MTDPADFYAAIRDEASTVLIGNDETVELLTIALLTNGHVLLEGVPGIAKTTIANLFARLTGLEYNRIQMTPDILPPDITGTQVYRESVGDFQLQRGPVFANIVVADEINRATPKTQSALLEAMEERRVTIGGETLPLPSPFMVVATQNPIEMEGTYELPEAQRDRFQFKLTVDIPDKAAELELVDRFDERPNLGPEDAEQVVTPDNILAAREAVAAVNIDDKVKEYVVDVVRATRDSEYVEFGGSPRATLAFLDAGKARAAIHGRDYVIPDDIKALATPVLAHRPVLNSDAHLSDVDPEDVVQEALATVSPPGSASATDARADDAAVSSDGGEATRPDTAE